MKTRKHREIRAAIFDLDGTLTDTRSIWQHLHEKLGTWDDGKKNSEMYHGGFIDYTQWAKLDAECWRNLPLSLLLSALEDIRYTPGARETMDQLRTHGIRTGIVSAGLSILADKAKIDLNADLAVSNELKVNRGVLTGEVAVRVGPGNKASIIEEAAWLLGAEIRETATIGDNTFDIPAAAGLKIAFKPVTHETRSVADVVVEDDDIRTVVEYILQ